MRGFLFYFVKAKETDQNQKKRMGYFGLFNLNVVKNKHFMRLIINSETDKLFKNACGYAILAYIGFKANLKKEVDANGCRQGECLLSGLDFYKNVTTLCI